MQAVGIPVLVEPTLTPTDVVLAHFETYKLKEFIPIVKQIPAKKFNIIYFIADNNQIILHSNNELHSTNAVLNFNWSSIQLWSNDPLIIPINLDQLQATLLIAQKYQKMDIYIKSTVGGKLTLRFVFCEKMEGVFKYYDLPEAQAPNITSQYVMELKYLMEHIVPEQYSKRYTVSSEGLAFLLKDCNNTHNSVSFPPTVDSNLILQPYDQKRKKGKTLTDSGTFNISIEPNAGPCLGPHYRPELDEKTWSLEDLHQFLKSPSSSKITLYFYDNYLLAISSHLMGSTYIFIQCRQDVLKVN
jgi:hypothetical protein